MVTVPSECGCNYEVKGYRALASAGAIQPHAAPGWKERLTVVDPAEPAPMAVTDADWPTYRRDPQRSASSSATVGDEPKILWQWKPAGATASAAALDPRLTPDFVATAPVAAAGHVWFASHDGTVRCVKAESGKEVWKFATNGMLFAPEQMSEVDFLNKTLRKVLKHCSTIQVYDEVMGNRWGDNFEYTIKTFLFWLEGFVAEPGKIQLHLYCGKPPGFLDNHMKGQLKSFRRGRLSNLPITIHFHDTLAGTDNLPHDRFLATDQIAIEIGRGMDFLTRRTRKNRDASFSLKDLTELGGFLKSAATSQIAPIPC